MTIQSIMSQPAVTCRPGDSLNTAARLMWNNDCGAIPVVDDEGRLAGIVTDRDICMSAFTRGGTLHSIQVRQAMANKVISCREDDTLQAAEELMSEHQIRRLPVTDADNRPTGILSVNDIAIYALSKKGKDGIDRELTETLAAICAPRMSTQMRAGA